MTDLQESLKNIYFRVQKGLIAEEGFVAQVEAAYRDSGYIHVSARPETQAAIANTMLGNKVMTGQEFYDRYQAELERLVGLKLVYRHTDLTDGIVAARKAAGLEVGDE